MIVWIMILATCLGLCAICFPSAYIPLLVFGLISLVFGLLLSWGTYLQVCDLTPSKTVCPSCGKSNLRISKINTAAKSTTIHTANTISTTSTAIESSKVAVCQDCGHDFVFYTEEDLRNLRLSKKFGAIFNTILCILFVCLVIWLSL